MTTLQGCMQMQNSLKNLALAERNKQKEKMAIVTSQMEIAGSELMDIKGIGKKSAERLISHGVDTREKLMALTEEQIAEITGNPLTAKGLMNSVKAMQI